MRVLKITSKNFDQILKEVIKSVKEDKVLVCPTDTVYGLICDATNEKAVKKLLKIKKRPKGKPIPIFVKDLKVAKKYACINKEQEKFLREFWPGKITIVLKRRRDCKLPKILFSGKKTIGLRIPNYKLVNELLKKLNFPLTSTSANISGKSSSTKIKEVINQFKNQKNKPDLIIDSGNLKPSKPSKVIDLTEKIPKILRS